MLNRRTLLTGIAASALLSTQVQSRTYTHSELRDFWRFVKEQRAASAEDLKRMTVERFGQLPIKFFGPRPNGKVIGVEIKDILPLVDGLPAKVAEMQDRIYSDTALVEYEIYAGGEDIFSLSQRHSYMPILLYPDT